MAYNLQTIEKELLETRPTFEEMNLNKISFAKEMEYALQAFAANPYLLTLDPATVKKCLVNTALSGLTLNPIMKMAYLVPRKGKCCLDPSYMGLCKILTDTGSVKSVKAKPVYSNEPFEIEQGSGGYVKHGICKNGNIGTRIGAYSIAVLNDGSEHVEWMYEAQLMGIKMRSESVKKGKASPWDTDEDEMIRKTVLKRHWKYLPKSERAIMAAQAIAFDDEANGIDFQEEKDRLNKEKFNQNNPSYTTPTAPEEALATEEDMQLIRDLISNERMPDVVFGSVHKKRASDIIEKKYAEGALVKSKAEEYIRGLQADLDAAPATTEPDYEEDHGGTE